ncbi:MAG: SCO7613 C-terminal domain-containing membrane protein, partial [Cellulosimicrobium funkei]|uniref:SCO7613 C-terminal domain-containing membrane protein n=1 Tax=Cellulosimicrobium funkei TaxID=264251 RepID=UPI003F8E7399
LVAGYFALAAGTGAGRTSGHPPAPARTARPLGGWPVGVVGSWRTLAPGLLALVGPSVLATYTDARTWRAMLVVVLALAAVLVGTRKHLAAPFLLGVAVLPVEILVVFVSQLGTRISAGPWMLTLAAAGGLLLIIATYYERRIAAYDGAAAYVRDLR